MSPLSLIFYLTVSTFWTTARIVDDQPYCALRYRRLCQEKGRHVACQFPDPGPGMACKNYSPIIFHNDLKHFITHYINRRRQRIAAGSERVRGGVHLPKPEVMMFVEWDRELAQLAQRLADQCTFIHDDCRATVRYPYAGQTVGEVRWRRSHESDSLTAQRAIRRVFDAWWGERRRVQPHQLTAPFRVTAKGAVWGHFSQLAVWSLRAVGCGAVRHGASYPRLLLVCDFSHTNMLGQRTITPGPLAPCPVHTARRMRSAYPLLCGPVRHPIKDRTDQDESDTEDYGIETTGTNKDKDDEDEQTITETIQNVTEAVVLRLPSNKEGWMKYSQPERTTKTRRDENPMVVFRTTTIRKRTKGLFIEKLDHELEGRKKVQDKYDGFPEWRFRPTGLSQESRRRTLMEYESLPTMGRKQTTVLIGAGEPEFRRFTDLPSTTDSHSPMVVRHKWKQTRDRPQRPGANALLNSPVTVVHAHRTYNIAMTLDKEDVDQLFRDTGFNPSWIRRQGNK